MQPISEVSGLQYILPPSLSEYPPHFSMSTSQNNSSPTCQFSRFLNFPQIPPQVPDFSIPQSNSFSSNSTSDEADEQQQSLISERKQRRMISNRESARRSRMRKQKHLDELFSQVVFLRNENHQLIEKLNHVSECQNKVMQENAQLKEETTELRQMLNDVQLSSHYSTLKDLESM